MPWTYHQETGALEDPEGTILSSSGYSGVGDAKNNGDAEYLLDGPIPRGTYFTRGAYDSPDLGPVVIRLVPAASNDMYCRSGFRIQGDSLADPGHAGVGCIVLNRSTREAIDKSADKILEVVR